METVRFRFRGQGPRWGRGLVVAVGLGFLIALAPGEWTSLPAARSQTGEVSYESEVQKATQFLRRRRYEEALKSFKRANEMREKKSVECWFGMAQSYYGLGAHKNVIESCEKMIEFAAGDKQLQAQAYNLKGIALQTLAEVKDQKKLQEAEATFRQGLALGTDLLILHYNLGITLLEEGRDPEGIVELKKYIELKPDPANVEQTMKMIDNPRRAREAFAPDFSVTTSEGEYLTLDDLHGKVVLLDFWGTWCPPCVSSVPSLRDLHKKYAKDKSFVMISVSVNDEEEKWRAFTAKNQMDWPQYLDREHTVERAFNVHAFPTYILIDHEGIVRFRGTGASFEKEMSLEDAIRKYMKIAAKTGPSE